MRYGPSGAAAEGQCSESGCGWLWAPFFRRATAQVESAPLVGNWIAHVLRGGDEVSATTLSRVFSVHSLLLPWVLGALVVFEGWFFALRLRGLKEKRA